MSSEPNQAYKVFFSYSHQDEGLRNELEIHLAMLRRQGLISGWHDRCIGPGREWEKEIDVHLREADVILLLVSAYFINSEYCYEKEMALAIKRHEAREAQVIPIILRPCDWAGAPFSKLQVLPLGARPVTEWPNTDNAFLSVTRGIRSVVESLHGKPWRATDDRAAPSNAGTYVAWRLPYLCDRADQDRAVSTALRRHLSVAPQRPFICLVHGDERECHGGFLQRMQESIIPQVLDPGVRQLAVKEYLLPWPENATAGRDFQRALWGHLGWALLGSSAAMKEEVIEKVVTHEHPLLITSDRLTEDFEASGPGLLDSFIKFWEGWEDLPLGRILISCVLIKHQRGEQARFWRGRRLRKANERLRKFVSRLEFSAYGRVSGIVVPELQAIRRSDVEAWIRDDRVRRFFTVQEKDVRDLYSEAALLSADGRIPMETLIEKLHALMRRAGDKPYVR